MKRSFRPQRLIEYRKELFGISGQDVASPTKLKHATDGRTDPLKNHPIFSEACQGKIGTPKWISPKNQKVQLVDIPFVELSDSL